MENSTENANIGDANKDEVQETTKRDHKEPIITIDIMFPQDSFAIPMCRNEALLHEPGKRVGGR